MYGVDQCRVCGKPIVVRNPRAAPDQEKAIRNPIVPEKEWRARGYLTPPTRSQWYADPADGCCGECGRYQLRIKFKSTYRIVFTAIGGVMVFVVIMYVITYIRH